MLLPVKGFSVWYSLDRTRTHDNTRQKTDRDQLQVIFFVTLTLAIYSFAHQIFLFVVYLVSSWARLGLFRGKYNKYKKRNTIQLSNCRTQSAKYGWRHRGVVDGGAIPLSPL